VAFDPFERVALGRTGLAVSRLAFGSATIGGLFREVPEQEAIETCVHAVAMGIRYFDVAPVYGYGNSERRLGAALATVPRSSVVVSTKVGRLLVDRDAPMAGLEVDHQRVDGQDDYFYRGTPPVRPVFDYTRDGVLRSIEASLERLCLDRIDIAYIHDPDEHWQAAIDEAYPALEQLRSEGVVRAIGVGMNQVSLLQRFAREGEFDAFLLANRYTLLDQQALPDLLPLCRERGIAVMLGGVFNSGILAEPRPGARFGYLPADTALVDRAQRLRDACERHGVPLRAAAVQFALAHPAVTSIVAGVRTSAQLDEYPDLMRRVIPAALWEELKDDRFLPDDAPVPAAEPPGMATQTPDVEDPA
jgi:D-threo-aldose 1-dehydrogenase